MYTETYNLKYIKIQFEIQFDFGHLIANTKLNFKDRDRYIISQCHFTSLAEMSSDLKEYKNSEN